MIIILIIAQNRSQVRFSKVIHIKKAHTMSLFYKLHYFFIVSLDVYFAMSILALLRKSAIIFSKLRCCKFFCKPSLTLS